MNMTAFLALEGPGIETGRLRDNGTKHHPAASASLAAGMLDREKMR
jgi:hypothetical protein